LIALLIGEPTAPRVKGLIGEDRAAITAVNLAETADVLRRRYEIERHRVRAAIATLTGQNLAVIAVEESVALRAADLRAENYHRSRRPISLADCILLAAAGTKDRVATADPHLLEVAAASGITALDLRA
jgi:predicted nucleic acid-binding protein